MHMRKSARFVLLLDGDCDAARRSAIDLAGEEGYVLIARTPASALEFARQYKPSHAVVTRTHADFNGKSLQELLSEYSPETQIVQISSEDSDLALGQGA